MAVLENGPLAHRKSLAASVALAQARTAGFARQAADPGLIRVAAMGANRAFRPKPFLDIGKSGVFVVEMGGGNQGLGHGISPMARILYQAYGVVKCNVAPRYSVMEVGRRRRIGFSGSGEIPSTRTSDFNRPVDFHRLR